MNPSFSAFSCNMSIKFVPNIDGTDQLGNSSNINNSHAEFSDIESDQLDNTSSIDSSHVEVSENESSNQSNIPEQVDENIVNSDSKKKEGM